MNKTLVAKLLETGAGKDLLKQMGMELSSVVRSTAFYYVGKPDGLLIDEKNFPESVVYAGKAHDTITSLFGGSVQFRFREHKKQTPGLLTPLGVKKIVHLYTLLYYAALSTSKPITFKTVRAGRQAEISEGTSFVGLLTSTTRLPLNKIIELGYGNKDGLAICHYTLHEGSVALDMEEFLGYSYPKPEEREVLLLPGNKQVVHCSGYDSDYLGRDGQPARIYHIDVYPPEFPVVITTQEELEKIVYNPDYISEIQQFYTALNNFDNGFPEIPACYPQWQAAFKDLVYSELRKLL